MRIGGIASGMDTEQMVRDLMKAERVRVDKYFRQEESLKWKREAFNTTNKTLAEFILKARSDFGLSKTTSTGTVIRSSTQSFDWVKKVSSSDETAINATASATAMEGTHTIQVTQLAEVARFTSGDLTSSLNKNLRFTETGTFTISTGDGKTATIEIEKGEDVIGSKVADLDFSIEKDVDGNIVKDNSLTFRINGKEIKLTEVYEINPGAEKDLVNHIQSSIGAADTSGITVSAEGGVLKFTSANPIVIDSSDMTDGDNPILKITDRLGLENGMSKGNSSINDIVKKINNAVDDDTNESLGLRAAYDSTLGKLMITAKESVEGQKIEIAGDLSDKFTIGNTNNIGKGAIVNFNGEEIRNLKSNNLSIFGINLQFQPVAMNRDITINVQSNADGIMDKVKGFVEDYNKLIDDLNGKLKQKSYRNFQPLTSEEKEAMKEKEIELWEEKAKSGLLRNDETITRVLQTMRSGLYESVYNGDSSDEANKLAGFNHLTQIGITTGSYQGGGKLEIDEEKLRNAIIDNPDGVVDLLFKSPDKDMVDANKRANTGLVNRLFDDMVVGMKEIVRKSGTGEDASLFRNVQSNMLIDFVTSGSISVMDRDIMNIGSRIANEERLLAGREDRYWRQFTAMEKALEKMNQQSGWLQSQLGQMG